MRKFTTTFFTVLAFCFFFVNMSFGQLYYESLIYDGQGQPQLGNITSVATSPDGKHVYACSYDNDAVNIYSRNGNTGSLAFEEAFANGENGLSGLGGAYSIVVSPDGNHVYVAGTSDNAIAVMKRNPVDGSLTFVEEQKNNVNGVFGLAGVISVVLSPDGNFLYACGADDNSIVVFQRNVLSGQLSFLERHQDDMGGIQNMSYPTSCMISPDGKSLYVASYFENAVVVFERNPETGVLSFLEEKVNNVGTVSGLSGAYSVYVSPDSKHVYVGSTEDSSVAVFERDENNGSLSFVEKLTDDMGGVDGLNGVIAISTSPDGSFLYANGAYEDKLSIFSRDANTGELSYINALTNGSNNVDGMSFPIALNFSQDGENIYVAGFYADAIVVFDRNVLTGELFFINKETASVDGIDGMGGANAIAMSPDGRNAYVCGKSENSIAVLERSLGNGQLNFVKKYTDGTDGVDGLRNADDVVVSPDGKQVYVCSFGEHAISVFNRNNTTGELAFAAVHKDGQNGNDGLNGANAITISPDGKNVYAVAYWEHGLSVFDRNTTNGSLSFQQVFKDNTNGVDGLSRPSDVIVSPDGKQVYVCSVFDKAVAVFNRNTTNGSLTYVERHKDGVSGVDGLNGAGGLAISPDGQQLLVAGTNDNALAVFDRNTNGTLTFREILQNGVDGVGGLGKVNSVLIGPSGEHIYATSGLENSIALFKRNVSTQEITFEKMQSDGVAQVNGLGGANNLAISDNGLFVYATSGNDNAVTVFSCTYVLNTVETICEGDSVVVGGHSYKTSGFFKDTFSFNSCRTIVELDLTVMPAEVNTSASICTGTSYTFGGASYSTPGTYSHDFASVSGCDSTVHLTLVVVNEFANIQDEAAICEGDSYSFGGEVYTNAGNYTKTFQSQGGCDSTVTLHLTVHQTYDIQLSEAICEGEFYVFGTSNYTTSGFYAQQLVSMYGCDSLVSLDLTVLSPGNDEVYKTICEGDVFEFGNTEYSQPGTYNTTITTSGGCQSVVMLHLSAAPSPLVTMEESICEGESFMFQGETLTTSGIYTYEYPAANGCDSTIILTLDVYSNNPQVTLNETICEGESFMMAGVAYTIAGSYQTTIPTQSGCGDSTIVLNLNVEPTATTINANICEGQSYSIGGQSYNLSGTYVQNITTSNGCNTEITLILAVHPSFEHNEEAAICFGNSYQFGPDLLTAAGNYTHTFAAVNGGCDSTVHLQLTVGTEIQSISSIQEDDGSGNGSISIAVSGGSSPYTFLWSTGQISQNVSNLSAGSYSLTITDFKGCEAIFAYTIDMNTSVLTVDELPIDLSLAPNPAQTNQEMKLIIGTASTLEVQAELYSSTGQMLSKQAIEVGAGTHHTAFRAPATTGLYLLRLRNQQGAVKSIQFVVY